MHSQRQFWIGRYSIVPTLLVGFTFWFTVHGWAQSPSHTLWDGLLKTHVHAQGKVDYKGFIKDREQLVTYLNQLSTHPPDKAVWSRHEQLSYWINAYNAFTVKLIIDHYPLKSITDLHSTVSGMGLKTIWDKRFFKIGGNPTSLNDIEHDVLRKKFNEPRIHFAINCASYSCPPLRREAYTPDKLEAQLQDQTVLFINDPKYNAIAPESVSISMLFQWFMGDFAQGGTLIAFLSQYAHSEIDDRARIKFREYNWALNE